MSPKFYILLLLLLAMAPSAFSIEADCPWKLRLLLGEHAAKRMDPADIAALESILQGVYHRPEMRTSQAEDFWLSEYGLDVSAEFLRQKGLAKKQVERKKTWRQRYAVSLGVALSAGFLGLLAHSGDEAENDPAAELNERYGLNLHETHDLLRLAQREKDDLAYLKAVLECNPSVPPGQAFDVPLALRRSSKQPGDDYFTTDVSTFREPIPLLKYLLADLQMIDRNHQNWVSNRSSLLAKYGRSGPALKEGIFADLMQRAWRDHGIIFCNRWGNPEFHFWNLLAITEAVALLAEIRPPVTPPPPMRLVASNKLETNERGGIRKSSQGYYHAFDRFSGIELINSLAKIKAEEFLQAWSPEIRAEWDRLRAKTLHYGGQSSHEELAEAIADIASLGNPPTQLLQDGDSQVLEFLKTHVLAKPYEPYLDLWKEGTSK